MADSVLTDVRRGKYSKPGEGLLLLGSLDEDLVRLGEPKLEAGAFFHRFVTSLEVAN